MSNSCYNNVISYGTGLIPNSICSLYGDFIKVGEIITSLPDNFGNFNSSEEIKGYHYIFHSFLNNFYYLNLNHFFPKNKNIRSIYIDKDGNSYFCKIENIKVDIHSSIPIDPKFKIQIYVKKEELNKDRDRRLNKDEMDLVRKLDKKNIKYSRFEIMDI